MNDGGFFDGLRLAVNTALAGDDTYVPTLSEKVALIQAFAAWGRFKEQGQQPVTESGLAELHEMIGDHFDGVFIHVGSPEWNAMVAEFDFLAEAFDEFTWGSVAESDDYPELSEAMSLLEQGVSYDSGGVSPNPDGATGGMMDEVQIAVSDWEGDARDAFINEIVNPYDDQLDRRRTLIGELASLRDAQQQALLAARVDVLNIADLAISALRWYAINKSPTEDAGATLQISGLVLGGVSALLGAVPPAAAFVAVVAGGVSAAGGSMASNVGGATLDDIVASITGSLGKVTTATEHAADAIEQAVDDDIAEILNGDGDNSFDTKIVGKKVDLLEFGYDEFTYPEGLS